MENPPGVVLRGIAKCLRIADIPAGLLALLAVLIGVFPTWAECYRWLVVAIAVALTVAYFWLAIRGSYEQGRREAKTAALLATLKARRDMSPAAVRQRTTAMKNLLVGLDRRASNQEDWEFSFGKIQEELLYCLDDLAAFEIADAWLTWMPFEPSDAKRLHRTAEKFGALVDRFIAQEMKQ